MSRKLKMKRQLIEEANKRLLGEQNEKLSDDYVNNLQANVQGLIAVEVKPGDTIDKIVKNSRKSDGIKLFDFEPDLNDHIKDPDKIYPGDVLFFMTDPTGIGYRNAEEFDEFMRQEKGIDKGRIEYLKKVDPELFKK